MTAELVCAASDRDAWLEARRSGVTATDIVTILGLGWSSEYALYWEKLGKLPPWEGSPRTRLGQELEPYVGGHWAAHHTEPDGDLWQGGLYRSPDRPWQLATPDRVLARDNRDPKAPVELKTWDDHDRAAWEDGMPPRVRAQVLWQMDTLGVGTGHVGVLFLPSGEFESRTIEHFLAAVTADADGGNPIRHELVKAELTGDVPPMDSCRTCADIAYMRQVGEAFWARVREGLPPFPDGSPATLAAVKALHAGVCAGSAEVDPDAWANYLDCRDLLAGAKEEAREAEAKLRLSLGDAETGTVGGEPVVKRTRYSVAGKTIERKPYEVDKLTRLGARNGDSDDGESTG